MRSYDVISKVGVGPVCLGMHREEARAVMGQEPETLQKTEECRYETDAYHQNAFQVFHEGRLAGELGRDEATAERVMAYATGQRQGGRETSH